MRIFNLKRLDQYQGSAGEITVVCKATGRRKTWNDAAIIGWCADLNGEPFKAYYSTEAIEELPLTPPEREQANAEMDNTRFAKK